MKFHNQSLESFSFLVTGGAGFIGSHLVHYLMSNGAGYVRVLDNLSTGFYKNISKYSDNSSFEFVKADISDLLTCEQACENIDFVFHQAALGSVPRSIKDPVSTNQTNIDGFLNMLEAARNKQVKRFVYASSSSVFGDSPVLPKTEDQLGNPLSPYAVTKRVNELYAHVFSRVYGMEIIGLRYFNIFGPSQNPDGPYAAAIPLFIDALINNKSPKIYGNGEQSRDFTFIDNAVQANMLAMFTDNKEAMGEVFNIAVGEQLTVNELFAILKECADSMLDPEYCDTRKGDILHSLADISKARRLLNYNPGVKAREGLKKTFDWFMNNLN